LIADRLVYRRAWSFTATSRAKILDQVTIHFGGCLTDKRPALYGFSRANLRQNLPGKYLQDNGFFAAVYV